jgi:PleD family two-component response regulator
MDSILQHSSSLPTSDERVASSQGLNHPRVTREERARLRLLIVEDNKVNQVVALGILENLGYQADVAADGRDALGERTTI